MLVNELPLAAFLYGSGHAPNGVPCRSCGRVIVPYPPGYFGPLKNPAEVHGFITNQNLWAANARCEDCIHGRSSRTNGRKLGDGLDMERARIAAKRKR